mgnify:CR=1 FL=1
MTHKMLLDVPDDVYISLVETAREKGQSPEALATQRLTDAFRGEELAPPDPLRKWIGAIQSDVVGWADDHDRFIGESIYSSMHDGKREDKSGG